jgi:D-amino-acid dehydrogenase
MIGVSMKVTVLGAGIIGVTTAWYLTRQGHEVTVVDRQPDAALETSFANGAQVSVCFCEPWASKEAPLKMLKWMTQPDAPLLYRFKLDPHQWLWGLQFLANCNDAAFARNVKQLVSLGRYSQAALHEIVSDTGIEFQNIKKGILHYFSTQAGLEGGAAGAALMQQYGVDRRILDRAGVLAIEPALASFGDQITGGTYTPTDESGDAKVFTQELVKRSRSSGAKFLFNHDIVSINTSLGSVRNVLIKDRTTGVSKNLNADAVVVAMGSYSRELVKPLGENLMIYPAKGYSATLKLRDPSKASQVSLLDDERKIAISRLGDSVRIAGTAELNGFDTSLDSATAKLRCAALVKRFEQIFPGVADTSNPHYWTGLRPSTPTNIPYIGRSKVKGLWINAGHGTLGWTHGAGSGKAMAELIDGRVPEFEFGFYGASVKGHGASTKRVEPSAGSMLGSRPS